jgi:predicted RNase H-like nuclease (RuvC/YqgF family)
MSTDNPNVLVSFLQIKSLEDENKKLKSDIMQLNRTIVVLNNELKRKQK